MQWGDETIWGGISYNKPYPGKGTEDWWVPGRSVLTCSSEAQAESQQQWQEWHHVYFKTARGIQSPAPVLPGTLEELVFVVPPAWIEDLQTLEWDMLSPDLFGPHYMSDLDLFICWMVVTLCLHSHLSLTPNF